MKRKKAGGVLKQKMNNQLMFQKPLEFPEQMTIKLTKAQYKDVLRISLDHNVSKPCVVRAALDAFLQK